MIVRRRLAAHQGGNESSAMFARPPSPQALRLAAAAALLALALSACSETITVHGHQFQENDLQRITTGMGQDQVRAALGSPTTTASIGTGSAYYYISSTEGQTSFFKPTEKDRKVLAVYFSQMGSVERVAQYGLKDGKVFDYVKRETPNHARDESMLKALFRSLGTKQLGLE
jgi:outer membrane protein assembly factor BamE (lipoprotein component of BamABCDE complex)